MSNAHLKIKVKINRTRGQIASMGLILTEILLCCLYNSIHKTLCKTFWNIDDKMHKSMTENILTIPLRQCDQKLYIKKTRTQLLDLESEANAN